MKKKIILVLSIMAIAICVFALSVSAEKTYFSENDYLDFTRILYTSSTDGFCHMDVTVEETSVNGTNIGFIFQYGEFQKNVVVGFINADFWHVIFSNYGVSGSSDLESAFDYAVNSGLIINEVTYVYEILLLYSDSIYTTYVNYLASINASTYDEGYEDGYSEGLNAGYNSGYSQGTTAGYNGGYVAGNEYGYTNGFYAGGDIGYESGITQGEELGFNNGYAAGGDNYKLSTEYDIAIADAWNAGRTNGYKQGYEDKASEFNPLALLISLLTVCELALVITVIVKKIRRRKRT